MTENLYPCITDSLVVCLVHCTSTVFQFKNFVYLKKIQISTCMVLASWTMVQGKSEIQKSQTAEARVGHRQRSRKTARLQEEGNSTPTETQTTGQCPANTSLHCQQKAATAGRATKSKCKHGGGRPQSTGGAGGEAHQPTAPLLREVGFKEAGSQALASSGRGSHGLHATWKARRADSAGGRVARAEALEQARPLCVTGSFLQVSTWATRYSLNSL